MGCRVPTTEDSLPLYRILRLGRGFACPQCGQREVYHRYRALYRCAVEPDIDQHCVRCDTRIRSVPIAGAESVADLGT